MTTDSDYQAQRDAVLREAELDTLAVRGGQQRPAEGEQSEPTRPAT